MANEKNEFSVESPSNGDLAEDVIREILLRLPVKTLLRFKCVCKLWYALIGSSSFVNQHLNHESNQELLLIRYYKISIRWYAFSLYVDEVFSRYEEPHHLQFPAAIEALLGPVNGIFCVVSRLKHMALLNPAMRQIKPLPLSHPNVEPNLISFDNVLGFGLDPVSGDYKLVLINYFWDDKMGARHDSPLVSIYRLSSDSWRRLEDVCLVNSSFCIRPLSNTYLDGAYHWLTADGSTILVFDFRTEMFRKIQAPDCILPKHLALYGDSIALLSYDNCINVWVMSMEGHWNKTSTVGPFQEISWPICFLKKNELLLETGTSLLVVCDVFTQELRTVKAGRKNKDFFMHWVFPYKECLVSIKGEEGNCMLWDTSSDFCKYFDENHQPTRYT